ncbi:MAG: 3-hydroxyacyl-CoA dehydrogenase family protein [Bacteroidales bacterium]|nr:3-hydroxyacyl-CoA dehydrogenase family protein [Bacteroidales bacterium]
MIEEKLDDYALGKSSGQKIKKIKAGIVGCGSMGQEIAILIAKAGIEVSFVEVSEEKIQESLKSIEKTIDNIIERWGMTSGDKRSIMSRISGSTNYDILSDCSIAIEAINTKKWVPNQPVRKEVFKNIEQAVSNDCIIASNASTVVISDLSVVLDNPTRAIGVHFIAPTLKTEIIEINRCRNTSKATVEFTKKFAATIGKDVVEIMGSPGNISTRIIVAMINEACTLLMEGVAEVADIDTTMMQGYGLQFGPFALADRIGLDKLTKWMEGLYNEYGDVKYKTSPLIRRMVRAGMLGQKVGEGFYMYKPDGTRYSKTGPVRTLGH